MVDVPSGPISLWPPGSGAKVLRAWAGKYGTQYGFTHPRQGQSEEFDDSPEQSAFRHALVASAIYLQTYDQNRKRGLSHDEADRRATAKTLGLGNLNEVYGANPLNRHLKDYWNNYEGVSLAREIAAKHGSGISNDDLAGIVAGEINRSIQSPIGKSRFILHDHDQNKSVPLTDPRLDVNRYDINRLPNEGWGIGPYPRADGYVPPAIIQAFPSLYQGFPPAPSPTPQSNPPASAPNIPGPVFSPPTTPQGAGGRTDIDPDGRQSVALSQTGSDQRQPPPRQEPPSVSLFSDLIPQPAGAQPKTAGQSPAYQQVALPSSPGLPQHVIDTGNYLRANGFEITPRTMYVSHVLGPQAAVDLFKRTGSTSSPAVPSPDAATGDQMRAWVRALRLGPAAQAGLIGGLARAPNAGPAVADPSNGNGVAPTGSWA